MSKTLEEKHLIVPTDKPCPKKSDAVDDILRKLKKKVKNKK